MRKEKDMYHDIIIISRMNNVLIYIFNLYYNLRLRNNIANSLDEVSKFGVPFCALSSGL